jgi:hypothetical protein
MLQQPIAMTNLYHHLRILISQIQTIAEARVMTIAVMYSKRKLRLTRITMIDCSMYIYSSAAKYIYIYTTP